MRETVLYPFFVAVTKPKRKFRVCIYLFFSSIQKIPMFH